MEAIKQIIPILLALSLAGLVLSVGLQASYRDLLYVVRRPRLLVKAIVAVDVIPPAAAILLTLMLPLEPVVKAGIVLMCISPVWRLCRPGPARHHNRAGGPDRRHLGLRAS
jgi:BASS family bile acid:Na+ symporter